MSTHGNPSTLSMRDERRRAALQYSLKMFETDWMREHMIGYSPSTDAAIISSPLQQLHSIHFETGSQFDPIYPTNDSFSAIAGGNNVIVPAFSRDGVNAGYFLLETYGMYADDHIMAHNGMCAARFLLEEETGTYIFLSRQSRADVLMCFSHEIRKSSFYYFAFPKDTFFSLMDNGVKDIAMYEAAVHHVFSGEYLKKCVSCGKLAGDPCACVFTFMRSKSPLDLSAVKLNIAQTHLSQASGQGLYEIFENGVSKHVIPMNARHEIFRLSKSGTSKKILNWAVSHSLSNVPMRIFHPISSFTSDFLSFNNSSEPVPVLLEPLISPAPTATHSLAPHTQAENNQPNRPDLPNSSTVPTPSTNACSVTVLPPPTIEVPAWPWNTSFRTNAAIISEPTPSGCLNGINDSAQSFLPTVPVVAPVQPASTIPGDMFSKPLHFTNQSCSYQPIRIAPRGSKNLTKSHPDDNAFQDDKMKKTEEELRAWRLYQRKLRNRESAARSNRARKERAIALRKELTKDSR